MVLKVDLSNAFNTVSRLHLLQAALHYTPAAYNYLSFAYSQPAFLFSGGTSFRSETGTHQGCPLGPLGFALGIQPVIEQLASHGQLIWSTWYLDDGLLVGSPEQVLSAFAFLRAEFESRGLHINTAKCETWDLERHHSWLNARK